MKQIVTSVPTFWATIYVGLKNRDTGVIFPEAAAKEIIQKYVDSVGLCVNVTRTEYLYTNGNEIGLQIGLINYPRFPTTEDVILGHALTLGQQLLIAAAQFKVSIVTPTRIYMLSKSEEETCR